ncbi:MAG: hypothetical protein ND895_07640 [Pyrinomonadaceae bacterium]|nr:hypothetical protein [Pyrinomonadaceae bacterium]
MRHLIWLPLLVLLLVKCSYAQSCNPASLYYIVRDEKGKVLSRAELTSTYEQLPRQIGDANTSIAEVSFTPDGETYYWPEDAEWEKGTKLPALLFANASTCTMNLNEVTLKYHDKEMRLVFGMNISRTQDDRRPVIDSLPFQNGAFKLDLMGFTPSRDKRIPATRWKRLKRPS